MLLFRADAWIQTKRESDPDVLVAVVLKIKILGSTIGNWSLSH